MSYGSQEKERCTNYFSKSVFFSSVVRTWCIGTSVWCVMLTKRSASENSSSRNWLDIATITYRYSVPDQSSERLEGTTDLAGRGGHISWKDYDASFYALLF